MRFMPSRTGLLTPDRCTLEPKSSRRQRGFLCLPPGFLAGGAGGGGSGDPHWANVLSMMNFTGTDFTDEKTGIAWAQAGTSSVAFTTSVGNPFSLGGQAADFTGSGAYLTYPSGFAFESGDWTIEAWVREALPGSYRCLFDGRYGSAAGNGLYVANPGGLNPTITDNSSVLATSSVGLPNNTWTHVEFDKNSGVIYMFVGGLAAGNATDSRTLATPVKELLGASTSGQFFGFYLGGWRVTGGIARHTSAFTPPAAPFPNHG